MKNIGHLVTSTSRAFFKLLYDIEINTNSNLSNVYNYSFFIQSI